MFRQPSGTRPIHRLNRAQQLTLSTWRLAARKLVRIVGPFAVLEYAALHAVLGTLRDVPDPLELFGRHAEAQPELALIASLVSLAPPDDLAYDILDTAFVLRWNELVADGSGPQELPPLRSRRQADEHRAGE